MKRIISVALALIMVFALTVAVSAKDSPSAKEYYMIKTATELEDGSLGTATADKNQVDKSAEGPDSQVTLTASQSSGFFTLWIIDGDYDIVSGSLESSVITIVPKSDIKATASFSVEEDYLNMTVKTVGDGKASVDIPRVKKGSGDTVTFLAEDLSETFTEWVLECKYDIVEGSLTDRKLVIRPYTDVHATAYFVGKGTTPDSSSSKSSSSGPDNNGTAPKTGDPLFIVIGLAVLALGAGALAVKKIKD